MRSLSVNNVPFYISIIVAIAVVLVGCSNTKNTESIHSVDFSNLTYSFPAELTEPGEKIASFTLKNGTLPATRTADGKIDKMGFSLGKVSYSDVTGDGLDDALVFVDIQTGGSALAGILYVFTAEEKSVRQVWSLTTGDRADAGFRNAYVENGELVIELNDPAGSSGDCCPTHFSRTKYKWNNDVFRQTNRELLAIATN